MLVEKQLELTGKVFDYGEMGVGLELLQQLAFMDHVIDFLNFLGTENEIQKKKLIMIVIISCQSRPVSKAHLIPLFIITIANSINYFKVELKMEHHETVKTLNSNLSFKIVPLVD